MNIKGIYQTHIQECEKKLVETIPSLSPYTSTFMQRIVTLTTTQVALKKKESGDNLR